MNFQPLYSRVWGVRLGLLCALAFQIPFVPALGAPTSTSSTLAKTNNVYPIDLPTALRLANAQNLDIQISRQRLQLFTRRLLQLV